MLVTVLRTAILMAAILSGCLHAGTLDDIRALEAGKTGRSAPAMDSLSLPDNRATTTTDRAVQNTSPVWYPLSDGRKVNLQDWKVVLFMQSTCQYCRQFAPVLKAFSRQTGLDVFPVSLDGKGDAEFPDVLPATPDVMVEYFQSGLPVATPTTFLTNVNTMETWPLLQGAAGAGEFRTRLDEVLRMALDRQAGKPLTSPSQGQR
ncbi:type-F conjugative transfer system pilin assembly thiol-disulfide isomerase TrbB [Klebsiella oxytoca]|jgi:type-F conjugative transfer system pilin assembly thiol-disulfide isomerase TrbB|uniref:type-F conjugative transfer system pilin assembly thiol-disulfide isomerase TrbB n=1 Tax=Enterobacteriaceae TaxID=543 RepID=UPI00026944E7|nr:MULTISPECIES: type-F conjugative transfer system pilin assembly thiol-disulfide isomerase TrbB [Enterobacteriaceae]EAN5345585.1 type-F conjugative transfer system pilin assembly thiol-disulfide isomerase TrbB [Salmonella enterica]ECC0672014.1 type-F conjugative transfer system pilin assembly thiol-disulfide isomerase TrbB [Salmonella enterica subsp. enterica serovar Minnesota]ECJ2484550.1 type-F conjugative transfer system pilin assembly thiol-disulfide isomerase TrbB [Salmonella enterica sub